MKVIGLTGGIGSGKSTVAELLAELGATVIDADKVGHEAFKPNTELWREVVSAFGQQILAPGGEIDRKKLGEIVFNDAEALARLNQIMHPRIHDIVKVKLEEYRKQGVVITVLEAALLIEASWTSLVDEVWVTLASEATVVQRLKQRGQLSEQQSLARIRSQMPNEERSECADVVIHNDGDLSQLENTVEELWHKLQTNKPEEN